MCGASDHTGCRWTDRSPRSGESRPSLRAVGGLAVLVCLAASVLVSSGVRLPGPGPGFGIGPMAPVLLGLAAGGDTGRDDDLERLTTAVEDLVARIDERKQRRTDALEPATDADTDADADPARGDAIRLDDLDDIRERDEEIDRLAAAIDDLAATVREREHQLPETERYRKELYRITSAADTSGEEKIRQLLELGCERLDVEAGFVSRIDEAADRYEVQIASENDVVQEGLETDLSNVYCRETIPSDDLLGIYNAAEEGYEDHPNYEVFGISCYLGGRIDVDGDRRGTLCFVDREPRDESFTATEKTFVDLMTRWVSHEFERREHERQLERYRQFTDDMLNAIDDIVYVLDEDGRLRRWNESVREVTGYADSDLESMHAVEFFQQSGQDAIADAIEAVAETGTSRVEADLVTAAGDRIPYEFVASTLEDPDGDRVIVGIGRDISDRKEKEQRLERYKAFTDDVLDAVDDIFYVLEEDGRLRRWNETLVDVTGYSHAEIEAMEGPLYFEENAMGKIEGSVDEAFETGETRIEVPIVTKGGERIPYEFVASRLEDPDGQPVEVGIGRDISDRKHYERELERTTQLLEQAQRLAGVGGWVLDVTGDANDLQLTDEAARIHGFAPDADVGLDRAIERYHPDDRPRIRQVIERAIETGDSYDLEVRLTDGADDQRWIRAIGDPVRENGDVVSIRGAVQDVTDRKMRERTLRETTQRLEAIIEASPAAIVALDRDDTVTLWNPAAERIFGWSDDEVVGEPVPFVPDDRSEEHQRLLERGVASETNVVVETRRQRKDGELIDVSLSVAPIRDADGEIIGTVGAIEDITERKARERDLQETKRRLELALEGSNTGIWEWNVDTDDIAWDETLERMLGLEPGGFEETYEGFRRRVHPDDVESVERALEAAVENSEPYRTEFRMRHADGHWLWFVARGRLVREGGETRMLGIVNDITQRKESERQLREREQQLQRYTEYTDDVLDAIDDVFYVLDAEYELQRWNASLAAVTGYSDAELDEMNSLELIAEDEREAIRSGLDNIDELRGAPLEADVVTKDGERIPFEFVAAPLSDPDGRPVIAGIGRDISERVEKERQLSRLISNIPGLVYRAANDPDWPIEFVSEGVREMTGYEPAALESGEIGWEADVKRGTGTWEQVQDALAAGERFNLIYPIETADGDRRWVKEQGRGVYADDGSVEAIEGVVIDITERVAYEQELERTTDLLERVQRMAAVGGWEVDVTDEPRTAIWTDELYRLHDLPRDIVPDLETTVQCYHPDDRSFVRERLETSMATESSYELEARVRSDSGDVRWVRANGEPIYEDGDLVKYRGSVQDITDQKEREQTLELLNETARGLLNSETEAAVADLVVDTATALLEDGSAAVYLLDAETNRFEPIASTADFGDRTDGAPSVAVGDSDSVLWNTYVTETQTVVDNAVTDEQSPLFGDGTGGLLVPIGDHGVFVLTAPPATIDDETRQLFETLVATTEAAFDRLESEASLRERDAELEARNRRLRRQIAINELIRRIDQSLIGAESRAEIERTVPERLVESDDIAFAWIGTVDGGTLEPRTWAGTGTGEAYLDAVSLEVADADSGADPGADDDTETGAEPAVPAVRTARSEQTTIVENVVDRLQQEGWRRDALDAGFQSVVAVPLAFEEYTYGVLAVYADEPDAFTDLEQTVVTELGESIANAINAVKTREALHAETFVELTLELSAGEDILSRIATVTGATVAYEGLGTASAEQTVLFFETSGVDADDVTTALENLVAVTDYRLIRETNGDCLFEATVAGEVVASRLVRYGGSPRTIAADGDRTTVTVDVPMGTDIREFVEMLRDHYASVELQSQRHVQRATQTRQELLAGLFEPLTDRQLEVLRTAYFAGFFEWPRESTGEEIAEMLEVTQPTVNRHLRIGQQRLLSQLFDDESLALTRE